MMYVDKNLLNLIKIVLGMCIWYLMKLLIKIIINHLLNLKKK